MIEILSISGDKRTLYRRVINPDESIFDYWIPAELGVTAEDMAAAPPYPDVYDEIDGLLSTAIVFHHTASSLIALRALSERYGLSLPEATYINSEKIVRRVWSECTKKGYGLRSMRQILNINRILSDTEAIDVILKIATEKAETDINGLIDLSSKPYSRNRHGSCLEGVEGNPDGPLFGETIVFTGSLDRPRSELRDMVVELGCTFADKLNKDTTILVVGTYNNPTVLTTGKSGKLAKAEKYNKEGKANIEILSSDSFYRMLSEFITNE